MDTCFRIEFDRADLQPKNVWADSFRVREDDNWVDFLNAENEVVSTVRTFNMVAIDRQCKAPAESVFRPEGPQNSSPPAGPVEAAMRSQGSVPQQGQPLQQQLQPPPPMQQQQPQQSQPLPQRQPGQQGPAAMAGRQ